MKAAGIRVEVDDRNEKIGYKIREAQMEKVSYMLVIGDKETEAGQVAIRRRDGEQFVLPADEFIATILKENEEKITF